MLDKPIILRVNITHFCLYNSFYNNVRSSCFNHCCCERMDEGRRSTFEDFANLVEKLEKKSRVVFDGGTVTALPWFEKALTFCRKKRVEADILVSSKEFFDSFRYFKILINRGLYKRPHYKNRPVLGSIGISFPPKGGITISQLGLLAECKNVFVCFVIGVSDPKTIWECRGVPVYFFGFKAVGNAKDIPYPQKKIDDTADWFSRSCKYFFSVSMDETAAEQLRIRYNRHQEPTYFSYYVDLCDGYVSPELGSEDKFYLKDVSFEEAVRKIDEKALDKYDDCGMISSAKGVQVDD